MAGDVVEDVISSPNKDFRLPNNEGMMSPTEDKDFAEGLMSMSSNEGLNEKRFRLEDFSLLTTIGTGTFARVCLCQEEHTRDYYALKVNHLIIFNEKQKSVYYRNCNIGWVEVSELSQIKYEPPKRSIHSTHNI